MTHTKVMICDDWACTGSANLDTLSLRINRELNLAFSHHASVQELANRVLLPDFRRSKLIRIEDTDALVNRLAEPLADQL
jgi:cardiolipin synthase